MPLWTIHHTPGIFTDDTKRDLASPDHRPLREGRATARFYVVVIFTETEHR